MGIGRRLYDLLRANVGHYLRPEGPVGPGPGWSPGPRPPGEGEPPRGPRATDPPPRPPPRPDRFRTAYRHLELPYGAGPEAVRSAHRKLMRRYHPDRFARDPTRLADATRLAQELTEERDLLLEALARGEIGGPG